MRLYRIEYEEWHADRGVRDVHAEWFGTQAEVAKRKRELLTGMDVCNELVTSEDVPTDKPGLLAWLNERKV